MAARKNVGPVEDAAQDDRSKDTLQCLGVIWSSRTVN